MIDSRKKNQTRPCYRLASVLPSLTTSMGEFSILGSVQRKKNPPVLIIWGSSQSAGVTYSRHGSLKYTERVLICDTQNLRPNATSRTYRSLQGLILSMLEKWMRKWPGGGLRYSLNRKDGKALWIKDPIANSSPPGQSVAHAKYLLPSNREGLPPPSSTPLYLQKELLKPLRSSHVYMNWAVNSPLLWR